MISTWFTPEMEAPQPPFSGRVHNGSVMHAKLEAVRTYIHTHMQTPNLGLVTILA